VILLNPSIELDENEELLRARVQEKEDEWALFMGSPTMDLTRLQQGANQRRIERQLKQLTYEKRKAQLDINEKRASEALGVLGFVQPEEHEFFQAPIDESVYLERSKIMEVDDAARADELNIDDDEFEDAVSPDEESTLFEEFMQRLADNKKVLRSARNKGSLKKFRKLAIKVRSLPEGKKCIVTINGDMFLSPDCTPIEVVALLESRGPRAMQLTREQIDSDSGMHYWSSGARL
jgi:hypothetical protein